MIFEYSPRFKRVYKKLPELVKKAFREKIDIFAENMKHPSLRVKKMSGTDSIHEASIDMNHRFTFEKIKGGVRFRVIGNHDIFKKP